MQALLDGKTIYCERNGEHVVRHEFKLSDDGTILGWQSYDKEWNRVPWLLNRIEGTVEEYPLTFEEALRAMLDGKVVMCKEPFHGYAYRFHNGRFEDSHVNDCFTRWEQCGMPTHRQNGKWKVVE